MDANYFNKLTEEETPFANRLAVIIKELFNPQSVVDVGCATGLYLKPFFDDGKKAVGYEINNEAFKLRVVPTILLADITKPIKVSKIYKFDVALCLEVAEHIEAKKAKTLISNLCKLSDTIIFTAAPPGQGGEGHINCQNQDYWIELFKAKGYSMNREYSGILRKEAMKGYHMGWFINNVMVFRKDEALMRLNFIWSGGQFIYGYYLSILTAMKTQKYSEAILWAVGAENYVPNKYIQLLQAKGLKFVPTWKEKQFPAAEMFENKLKYAVVKDYWLWYLGYNHGGIFMDLDTISLRDISNLIGDKEIAVPLDIEREEDCEHPFNNAIVIIKKNSHIALALSVESESRLMNSTMSWGDTGPALLTNIIKKNRKEVEIIPFRQVGGYSGHECMELYQRNGMLIQQASVIHCFSVASGFNFDLITPEYIRNVVCPYTTYVKSVLTHEEWDTDENPEPKKFFLEIGCNTWDTLDYLVDDGGWEGMMIEAVPEYFDRLPKKEGITYLNYAITNDKYVDRKLIIYYIPKDTIIRKGLPQWMEGIGSLDYQHLKDEGADVVDIVGKEINPMSVRTLLNMYSINKIDYLKIDAEGWDCRILEEFDLSKISKIKFERKHAKEDELNHIIDKLRKQRFSIIYDGDNIIAEYRPDVTVSAPDISNNTWNDWKTGTQWERGGKLRFHLLGLAHVPTSKLIYSCAYTQKVVNLCKMLMDLGHEVYLYCGEGSDIQATERITVVTDEQRKAVYGDYDYGTTFFKHDPKDAVHQTFNANAILEINKRKQEKDILLVPMGNYHQPISEGTGLMTVESGIGYTGVFAKNRIFESYAWMHYVYGLLRQDDGYWYDAVIPNSYDPEDFPFNPDIKRSDYFVFIGRLIQRKGLQVAIEATERIGSKLIVAGQGNLKDVEGRDFSNYKHVTHVGSVTPGGRAKLIGEARGVFVPTYYIGPFEGVAVESQLLGTPVITTDWGVFSETVLHGKTGYRCRTMEEFVWAGKNISNINPQDCRDFAMSNYSIDRVKYMYETYFQRVYELWKDGWYAKNPNRTELDWLNRTYL